MDDKREYSDGQRLRNHAAARMARNVLRATDDSPDQESKISSDSCLRLDGQRILSAGKPHQPDESGDYAKDAGA